MKFKSAKNPLALTSRSPTYYHVTLSVHELLTLVIKYGQLGEGDVNSGKRTIHPYIRD